MLRLLQISKSITLKMDRYGMAEEILVKIFDHLSRPNSRDAAQGSPDHTQGLSGVFTISAHSVQMPWLTVTAASIGNSVRGCCQTPSLCRIFLHQAQMVMNGRRA